MARRCSPCCVGCSCRCGCAARWRGESGLNYRVAVLLVLVAIDLITETALWRVSVVAFLGRELALGVAVGAVGGVLAARAAAHADRLPNGSGLGRIARRGGARLRRRGDARRLGISRRLSRRPRSWCRAARCIESPRSRFTAASRWSPRSGCSSLWAAGVPEPVRPNRGQGRAVGTDNRARGAAGRRRAGHHPPGLCRLRASPCWPGAGSAAPYR